ncbi:hypothetical protein EB796_009137 [Bugula neritina]|uniref:PXDN n=1 Tax=Bugula neritina TaxID=10212 RepID=A0A7J7K4M8_BUGNE|nr:hypothetical protein EB796_009137 [Bugula neritina]
MLPLLRCHHLISAAPYSCDPEAPYRSADGSCNNLRYPEWGQSRRPFNRMPTQVAYGDGVNSPRTKSVVGGKSLPSARKVSTAVFRLSRSADSSSTHTQMHMAWGQFIDHDISLTPKPSSFNCCDSEGNIVRPTLGHQCFSIPVPDDDPFYSVSCLPLIRSDAVMAGDCNKLYREQINNLTPFLDAGIVYGSTESEAKELRLFSGGKLRSGSDGILPVKPTGSQCGIPPSSPVQSCFLAGDKRVNEWTGMTALHNTFLEEHNRIADFFYTKYVKLFPHWTGKHLDEEVYQKTRRILAAQIQVIIYGEYIPVTLNSDTISEYDLRLGEPHYDPDLQPQALNEFATAAFRYGHSEIPFGLLPVDKEYNAEAPGLLSLVRLFHQPVSFLDAGHDAITRGLVSAPADKVNERFTTNIQDQLFKKSTRNKVGEDLLALNIQRARDHARDCGNACCRVARLQRLQTSVWITAAKSFEELSDHNEKMKKSLSSVYKHVDDIDLFPGGITETNLPGSLVGPVFSCIIAQQFSILKKADRFWFENVDTYPHPFTAEQIHNLSQYTLAKVICNNHDVETIPKKVFELQSSRVDCSEIPDLDLSIFL